MRANSDTAAMTLAHAERILRRKLLNDRAQFGAARQHGNLSGAVRLLSAFGGLAGGAKARTVI